MGINVEVSHLKERQTIYLWSDITSLSFANAAEFELEFTNQEIVLNFPTNSLHILGFSWVSLCFLSYQNGCDKKQFGT